MMITRQQQVELDGWLCAHFGMPEHFSDGSFMTGGYKGPAVVTAAYNIGVVARERTPTGEPIDAALSTAYDELVKETARYTYSYKERDWDLDANKANFKRIVRDHKELILRVAHELWDLFPEIYARYGSEHPNMEPKAFFGLHTRGTPVFLIDHVRVCMEEGIPSPLW
jgi:hypothetical protein